MGKKATLAALVICFVAMITVVGVYTFGSTQEKERNQTTPLNLDTEQANTNDIINENTSKDIESYQYLENGVVTNDHINENTERKVESQVEPQVDTKVDTKIESVVDKPVATNQEITQQVTFTENSSMMWPISGGVIMKYNMEEPVYFATLDQYKRNPAMIIQGTVGDEVMAAARGIVADISANEKTGNTIMVDIGGGYTVLYGQMGEVSVEAGSIVEKGQVLGTLAEPTKYYSVEGPNLYFQMLYKGETVDPLMFLE